MEYFDEQSLRNRLESLPSWKWIAFMLLCCERMVPNFERFSMEASFGDGAVLRSGLRAVWHWLATSQLPQNLKDLRNACKEQAPDTENFQSEFTSAALDAATATEIVLDALEQPLISMVVEVAGLSRDTIDLYVQAIRDLDPTAKTFDAAIVADPLMQRELSRQREDLDALDSLGDDRSVAAAQIHEIAKGYIAGSLS
jgi:uncharacterized protein YjaG (DUF416 family)